MTLPEPKVCWLRPAVLWTPAYVIGYMLAILGRAKGHDHQAACGPSRLGAYAVRLCALAHWRGCRWRDRTCRHRSPLVQRTSRLSLRLGMASSPLRGLVRKLISGQKALPFPARSMALTSVAASLRRGGFQAVREPVLRSGRRTHRAVDYPDDVKVARAVRLGCGALGPNGLRLTA